MSNATDGEQPGGASSKTSRLRLEIMASTGREHAAYLRRHLPRAWSRIRHAPMELSLALVGDARMSSLHQRFMDIPTTTDVLTFPLEEDARGRVVSGEVVVCVPEARRRAQGSGMPVQRELLLYALHGLLHLSGFDDTTEQGYRKMHAMEDRILEELGIGRTFSPAPPRPAKRATGRAQARGGAA